MKNNKKPAFTKYPKILEEVLWHYRLGFVERAIVGIVIHKTLGWDNGESHKTEAIISTRYISKMTGLWRRSVRRSINNLIEKNIVIKTVKPYKELTRDEKRYIPSIRSKITFLSLNENYSEWENIDRWFPELEERIERWANGLTDEQKEFIEKILAEDDDI